MHFLMWKGNLGKVVYCALWCIATVTRGVSLTPQR